MTKTLKQNEAEGTGRCHRHHIRSPPHRHHNFPWRQSLYSHERPQPCNVIWIRTQRLLARLQQQVRRLQTWDDERFTISRHSVLYAYGVCTRLAGQPVGCRRIQIIS